MEKIATGKFTAYQCDSETVLVMGEDGQECCRITASFSKMPEAARTEAVNTVLAALQAQPLLESKAAELADSADTVLGFFTPDGENEDRPSNSQLAHLQASITDMRCTIGTTNREFATKYKLTMRNNVGEDSTEIQTFIGQDKDEVAERVAASYGAKVVSLELLM